MKLKQWQEIRAMSDAELAAKLRGAEEEIFRLKFRHAATPVKNGLAIRKLRRSIAQFNTLLRERAASAAKAKK
jgi:ribosomal protein L29